MGTTKYTYHLEILDPGKGAWVTLLGTEDALAYNLGRLAERRESPAPRLATRCVRSDGRVMDEVPAKTDASVGMVAGFPTQLQYAQAALRALERGGIDSFATDAVRELVEELRGPAPEGGR